MLKWFCVDTKKNHRLIAKLENSKASDFCFFINKPNKPGWNY